MDWCEFERSQAQFAANAFGKAGARKSGHGGRALRTGLLTCGRSGRGLAVVQGSTLRRRYCRQHRCSGRQWRNRRKVEQFGAVQVGDRNRPQLLPRACHMRGRCLPTVVMRSFHSLRSVELSGWGRCCGPIDGRRDGLLSRSGARPELVAVASRGAAAAVVGGSGFRLAMSAHPGRRPVEAGTAGDTLHRYQLTLFPSISILKGEVDIKMLGSSYVALDQCQQLPIHTG